MGWLRRMFRGRTFVDAIEDSYRYPQLSRSPSTITQTTIAYDPVLNDYMPVTVTRYSADDLMIPSHLLSVGPQTDQQEELQQRLAELVKQYGLPLTMTFLSKT